MKHILKEKAINLRREGKSYNEILMHVPVAKSTLSLWLRSVGLSRVQKQRLTDKKRASIERGWKAWNQIRIDRTRIIKLEAREEIRNIKIDRDKLFLIGAVLYWAEGAKEKEYRSGQGIIFSNSDKYMIKVFLKYLKDVLLISRERIYYDIYAHENCRSRSETIIAYWKAELGEFTNNFGKIYYKKHNITSKRRNSGNNYFGLVRLKVSKSSSITRRITGIVEGICIECGIV